MSEPVPENSARRWPLKLALALLAVPILLELGWRGLLRWRGTAWDGEQARARVAQITSSMRSSVPAIEPAEFAAEPREELRALSPYYGWESPQSQQALGEQQAFFQGPERGRVFSVMILGGSVAQHMGNGAATPGKFREILGPLARVGGREVQLLDWARGSFKQPQQEMLFAYLIEMGIVPDALIEIDGFNEVALGNDNAQRGIHPLQPHWPMWGRLASGRALSGDTLDRLAELYLLRREAAAEQSGGLAFTSAVLGSWELARVERLYARFGAAQERLVATISAGTEDDLARGPRYTKDGTAALEECARGWEQGSRALAALCRAQGVVYLHVLQPTLHDEGAKPMTAEEIEHGRAADSWIEGALRGYPLLREHGARLIADGVAFVDLSRLFVDWQETAYVDCCHFRGASMRHFAERVARELAAQLESR